MPDTANPSAGDDVTTVPEFIRQQQGLERDARELMPYDPDQCTYSKGPLRQDVYACLTCSEKSGTPCGVCFACSIRCHSTHQLVELFTKRDFVCDCGTTRCGGTVCHAREKSNSNRAINDGKDIPSLANKYNDNYKGVFCSCKRPYNPMEDTNMFQCAFGDACGEDWYHEECLMGLKPGVVDRKPTSQRENNGESRLESLGEPGLDAREDSKNNSIEEIKPMPDFPDLALFDSIVCWKCVHKYPEQFQRIADALGCIRVEHIEGCTTVDERRKALGRREDEEPAAKRQKTSTSPQTAPDYNLLLKDNYKKQLKTIVDGNKDQVLCKFLRQFPFMYSDDPVYQPPEDSDSESSSSIFELGLRELHKVPVEQAITGMEAYDKIKSKLTEFLKPFAEQKKVVTEDEVKRFFGGLK